MKALLQTVVVSVSFCVARIVLAAPGNLDPSFSGNGLLSMHGPGDTEAQAHAITQQTDGKLVLAGWGHVGFLVARINEDGTADSTFGTDGFATAVFQGGNDIAMAVIQQSDGKLVLAGFADSAGTGEDIALARFNFDGTLDSTFGSEGTVTLDLGGSDDRADALIQQDDGKLVIVGASISDNRYHMLYARINSDGTIDTSFGSGGTALVDFGVATESTGSALVEQSDAKLVAVGTVYPSGLGSSRYIGIARITENGALDPSFDGDGSLVVDLTEGVGLGAVIQPDGAILIAGYTILPGASGRAALLRVNGDGSIDNSFGTDSFATIDLGEWSFLGSVIAEQDGMIVAAGGTRISFPGAQDMVLTRFDSDGTLDATFGVNGVATADFGTGSTALASRADEMIRQSDGKYVAVGWNELYAMSAARFDNDAEFPGLIGLRSTAQVVDETAGSVTYAVRRTGGTAGTVSVNYASQSGDAEAALDFEAVSGTLTWTDGDASDQSIVIHLLEDVVEEAEESFALNISGPTGGARLAARNANTRIFSEDGAGQVQFKFALDVIRVSEADPLCDDGGIGFRVFIERSGGSTGAVSVDFATVEGTARAPDDFFAKSGNISWGDGEHGSKILEFDVVPDRLAEETEQFQIQLSHATGGATLNSLTRNQIVQILNADNSRCGPPTTQPPPPGGGGGGGNGGGGLGTGGGGGAQGLLSVLLLGLARLLQAITRRSRTSGAGAR